MKYQARNMMQKDLAIIEKLEESCFFHPWSSCVLRQQIENPCCLCLVLEEITSSRDSHIVGFCIMTLVCEVADLEQIAISAKVRRQGLAQMIFDEAKIRCIAKGIERILLEVRLSNTSAITFYEKNGFHKINIRKSYYKHPVEDALVMQYDFASLA